MNFTPPRTFTSTQIQAEFYRRARNANLEIWLEYQVKTKYGHKCRFDAVIVVAQQIVAIVACKRSAGAARGITRQRARYESFGVPVIWVRGMDKVPAAITEARRHALTAGQPLSEADVAELGLSDVVE